MPIQIGIEYNENWGWYCHRANPRAGFEYLGKDGKWYGMCTHCWYDTKEEVIAILDKIYGRYGWEVENNPDPLLDLKRLVMECQ